MTELLRILCRTCFFILMFVLGGITACIVISFPWQSLITVGGVLFVVMAAYGLIDVIDRNEWEGP